MYDKAASLPADVLPMLERAITCEFATLTKRGTPVTFPLNPYLSDDGRTIDVSTGLSYPAKAERARRNPKVTVLYSDMVGLDLPNAPVVLVYGHAAVRDADLQANADKYIRLAMTKYPAAYKGQPRFLLKRQAWYFARIWIEVTPLKILWWPEGKLDEPAREWTAPADTRLPASDPAPKGKQAAPWADVPSEWRWGAETAVRYMGLPTLTVVDREGYPVALPVKMVSLAPEGFLLEMPKGIPTEATGKACLTYHVHPKVFDRQENMVFVGEAEQSGDATLFKVERRLADFSLGNSRLATMLTFFRSARKLTPQLKSEAARRGQPVPKVNL